MGSRGAMDDSRYRFVLFTDVALSVDGASWN